MLAHSGMTDISEPYLEMDHCIQNPEKAWEEWKELEGRNRYRRSVHLDVP